MPAMKWWVAALGAIALFGATARARADSTCNDGMKNGPESDVDCGGDCGSCAIGKKCSAARDCVSGLCAEGVCAERDFDLHEGQPPPGYDVRTASSDSGATARRAGILFFGVGYGAAYVSALSYPARLSWMYAPVLGPWLTLGQVEEKGYKGLLIADGAFQAAGALILIGGIASGGQQLVRTPSTAVHVLPSFSSHRASLDFYGAF